MKHLQAPTSTESDGFTYKHAHVKGLMNKLLLLPWMDFILVDYIAFMPHGSARVWAGLVPPVRGCWKHLVDGVVSVGVVVETVGGVSHAACSWVMSVSVPGRGLEEDFPAEPCCTNISF